MHTQHGTKAPKTDINTHVRVEPVRHELELAVRRDEGDGAVVLKARQTDTLVKLHIFYGHSLTLVSYKNTRQIQTKVESN